jgi:2,4-dienoyl-CoA reductase (NADPH2)
VGDPTEVRGGVDGIRPEPQTPARDIVLLQRRAGKLGGGLGKTTGWIHRAALAAKGVRMLGGITYRAITAEGLLVERDGREELIAVDDIVLCAGQEPERSLADRLGRPYHIIGGADVAAELDAKRAIDQGARLAARL